MHQITVYRFLVLVVLLLLGSMRVAAQGTHEEAEVHYPFHDVVISSSISFIPGVVNPDTKANAFYFAPSIGIGYTLALNEHFGLATKNDIEFVNLDVRYGEDGDGETALLRRENVFVLTAGGLYAPFPRAAIYVGAGAELDQHEVLPVISVALEYDVVEEERKRRGLGAGVEAGVHYKTAYTSFFVGLFIAFGWW